MSYCFLFCTGYLLNDEFKRVHGDNITADLPVDGIMILRGDCDY